MGKVTARWASCKVLIRIPTVTPFVFVNSVVQSIELCVGDHGVTFKHHCHGIGRGEESEFCPSIDFAHLQ